MPSGRERLDLKRMLFAYDQIEFPPVGVESYHVHFFQKPPEMRDLPGRELRAALLLQDFVNLASRHSRALLTVDGRTEKSEKEIFVQWTLLELLVRLHLPLLLFGHKPITLPFVQRRDGLRVKLVVFDRLRIVDPAFHFDADEAAASGRVAQQVRVVAGRDERGVATDGFHLGGIRFAQVHDRFLQQVLQESLVLFADLVELVDVDQAETGQVKLGIPPFAEVDAVRIIGTQSGWKQVQAERGLPAPLPARGETLLPCLRSRPCQWATIERNQM